MKSVTLEEQMAFQTPLCFVDQITNDCKFFKVHQDPRQKFHTEEVWSFLNLALFAYNLLFCTSYNRMAFETTFVTRELRGGQLQI